MLYGAPGGETIGYLTFEAIVNVIDFGLGIQEAVSRQHLEMTVKPDYYTPGAEIGLRLDRRFSLESLAKVKTELEAMGHTVTYRDVGVNVGGIVVDQTTGVLTAGAGVGYRGCVGLAF